MILKMREKKTFVSDLQFVAAIKFQQKKSTVAIIGFLNFTRIMIDISV